MNLRKTLIAAVAVLSIPLASCGTTRRAGKDLGIVVTSPILIPYAGFTDGFANAGEVADGLCLGASPGYELLSIPFTTLFGLVKHTFLVGIHAIDFFAFPIYGAAELHPYGPEVEPLDYYEGTLFDRDDTPSGTDAETGAMDR